MRKGSEGGREGGSEEGWKVHEGNKGRGGGLICH